MTRMPRKQKSSFPPNLRSFLHHFLLRTHPRSFHLPHHRPQTLHDTSLPNQHLQSASSKSSLCLFHAPYQLPCHLALALSPSPSPGWGSGSSSCSLTEMRHLLLAPRGGYLRMTSWNTRRASSAAQTGLRSVSGPARSRWDCLFCQPRV